MLKLLTVYRLFLNQKQDRTHILTASLELQTLHVPILKRQESAVLNFQHQRFHNVISLHSQTLLLKM